jgi:hypothetical protein
MIVTALLKRETTLGAWGMEIKPLRLAIEQGMERKKPAFLIPLSGQSYERGIIVMLRIEIEGLLPPSLDYRVGNRRGLI